MFYTLKEVPVFQFTNSVMYLMEEEHVKQTKIMYWFCRTLDHFFSAEHSIISLCWTDLMVGSHHLRVHIGHVGFFAKCLPSLETAASLSSEAPLFFRNDAASCWSQCVAWWRGSPTLLVFMLIARTFQQHLQRIFWALLQSDRRLLCMLDCSWSPAQWDRAGKFRGDLLFTVFISPCGRPFELKSHICLCFSVC